MNSLTLKILKSLFIVDALLMLFSIIFFDVKTLWSMQIGFMSASLVMLASMKSYRRMVDARVELNIITIDDTRDTIDKLEDEHDLYSKDVIMEDEKEHIGKNRRSLGETIRDAKAALSLNRIASYVVLVLGFFYLNRHALLLVPVYIFALTIPMLVVVFVLLSSKDKQIISNKGL